MSSTISPSELKEIRVEFQLIDSDGSSTLDKHELNELFIKFNQKVPMSEIEAMIAEVSNDGELTFDQFISIVTSIRQGKDSSGIGKYLKKFLRICKVEAGNSYHSYSLAEVSGTVGFINSTLKDDELVADKLPLADDPDALFDSLGDGLVLSSLVNKVEPGTIHTDALNKPKAGKPLNRFHCLENLQLALSSCKSVGFTVISMGPEDIISGAPHLCLGLLWQAVRSLLGQSVNITKHPELAVLLERGEDLEEFIKLPAETILLRWVNFHLKNAGQDQIKNFGEDLVDGRVLAHLLAEITKRTCRVDAESILALAEGRPRVSRILEIIREDLKAKPVATLRSVLAANEKMNLVLLAELFETCPGLYAEEEDNMEELLAQLAAYSSSNALTAEERQFTNWINNLDESIKINDMYTDLKDGVILAKVIDQIVPGAVDFKRIQLPKGDRKLNKFAILGNCNYVLDRLSHIGIKLVNIDANCIADSDRKMLPSILFQAQRAHMIKSHSSVLGANVTDKMLLEIANNLVTSVGGQPVPSTRDRSLSNSMFFYHLLDAVFPGKMNRQIMKPGNDEEEKIMNARYVLTMMRKLCDSVIFASDEHLVQVNSRFINSILIAIVGQHMSNEKEASQ
ncbi:hypothetical protein P9112_008859 [Eukaryota sp. TZLM1-RC]